MMFRGQDWGNDRRAKGGYADAVDRVFGTVERPGVRASVWSGMEAGFMGGLAMLAALAAGYDSAGSSPFLPLQVLTYAITGQAGFAASVAGLIYALAVVLSGAASLGALFGLIMAKWVGRLGLLGAAGVGMTYGLLVWIVTQFVIAAFAVPDVTALYDQHALALAHGVYGICLGLFGRAYHKISSSW